MSRRTDLAEFLRARRAVLTPGDVGLIAGARRRTQGLRREEVALLANVSVSWYTWLEQGRPINASLDVIDALARALLLDPVEREHLLALSGYPNRGAINPGRDTAPDAVVRILDSLAPSPAYVIGPRWDFLAWNAPFECLYPQVKDLAPEVRNLVWVMFAEPSARTLIGDWEAEARRVLSQFRAESLPVRDDPAVANMVANLRSLSHEFNTWWTRHDIGGFESHRRVFHHNDAGRLEFITQQLIPAGDPDLRIVVHLAIDGDDSTERLSAALHPH